jgi:hypothetical protein
VEKPPDTFLKLRVDACRQDRRWLEDHHTARRDPHLLAGLGVPTHALSSLANDEGPERGKPHRLAAFNYSVISLIKISTSAADWMREIRSLIDGLRQMQPCDSFLGHARHSKRCFTFDRPLRLD